MSATVLIVDDEVDSADLLGELLELKGYRTLVAYDGVEGLAMATSERPDLVLTDVMMPRMDGLELAARLGRNSDTQDVPVVVMSALDGVDHEPALVKPVDLPELLRVLEEQLGRR